MPLTNIQIRGAQPRDKGFKLHDTLGLHIFVSPTGFKSWRFRYRYLGKEKQILLGSFPETTLAQARDLRDEARRLLREHRDPALEAHKRKLRAQAAARNTFDEFASRWHEAQKARWSPVQIKKVDQALRRDVLPDLGRLPLTDIDGPMVLQVLRKVEGRGAVETAKRIRQHISGVFEFAMAEGAIGFDPASGVKRALRPNPPAGRQPAVRTIEEARHVVASVDASTSDPSTKLASRLLALTATRPGVVRAAVWSEFEHIDWARPDRPSPDARWRVPAARMKLALEDKAKGAFEHEMPLAQAAVDVLHQVRRLTGRFQHVFAGVRSPRQPMSENALNYMYARNGWAKRHVPHGWRSTFSTVMNGQAVANRRPEDRAIIDGMLAHKPRGVSESEFAYNRAVHWERRREIAQEWADLLMSGLPPASSLLNEAGG
jgi:hypothetical protein